MHNTKLYGNFTWRDTSELPKCKRRDRAFSGTAVALGNGEGSARGAVAVAVAVRAQASRDPSECEQMMLSVQPAPNSESF
jgi:hypothetical protein